jgi:hypothetical protein
MQNQGPQPTDGDVAERMTSRISNSLVIAAGLVALGLYASGDDYEAPTYQVVSTPDGRVVRLNTDSGSIVSCDTRRCTLIYLDGERLPRVDGRSPDDGAEDGGEGAGERGGQPPAAAGPTPAQQPALPAPAGEAPPGTAPQPPEVGAAPQAPQPQPAPARPQR